MSDPDVRELAQRVRQVVDPEVASAKESQRGRRYKLGALPPDDDRP